MIANNRSAWRCPNRPLSAGPSHRRGVWFRRRRPSSATTGSTAKSA